MHGHTRLEVIWTVVPVIDRLRDRRSSSSTSCPGSRTPRRPPTRCRITVGGTSTTGSSTTRTGRARSTPLRARRPGGRPHRRLAGRDPQLVDPGARRQDPGDPRPDEPLLVQGRQAGTYTGQCAELCGVFHAKMTARVIVGTSAEYTRFVSSTATTGARRGRVRRRLREVPRHAGQGRLRAEPRENPLLEQPAALTAIVRNGRRAHAGGRRHLDRGADAALAQYVKAHVYKGAAASGG